MPSDTKRNRRSGWKMLLIIVGIGLISCFIYLNVSEKPQEPKVAIQSAGFVLRSEMTAGEMELFGTLQANKQSDLSAKASGRISLVRVSEGDMVRSGQFLANVSPDQFGIDYRKKSDNYANFEQYRKDQNAYWDKQVKSAEENLDTKKAERDYYATADPSRLGIYEENVDKAEEDVKSAKRQRDAQNKSLKEQSVGYAYDTDTSAQYVTDTRIMAPFSAVVTKKYVEVGEVVSAGMPVVSVADMSRVKVIVQVPDTMIDRLSSGLVGRVLLDGISGEYGAKVTIVYPQVDPTSKKIAVELTLDSVPRGAKVDMFARVFLRFPERAAFFVPNNYVLSGFEGPYVILGDGKQKLVQRGEQRDGQTEIMFDGIANDITIFRNSNGAQE